MRFVKLAVVLVCLLAVPSALLAADGDSTKKAPGVAAQEQTQAVAVEAEKSQEIDFQPFESATDYWIPRFDEGGEATQSLIWGSCTQSCAPCRKNSDCPPDGPLIQKCWPYCP